MSEVFEFFSRLVSGIVQSLVALGATVGDHGFPGFMGAGMGDSGSGGCDGTRWSFLQQGRPLGGRALPTRGATDRKVTHDTAPAADSSIVYHGKVHAAKNNPLASLAHEGVAISSPQGLQHLCPTARKISRGLQRGR